MRSNLEKLGGHLTAHQLVLCGDGQINKTEVDKRTEDHFIHYK